MHKTTTTAEKAAKNEDIVMEAMKAMKAMKAAKKAAKNEDKAKNAKKPVVKAMKAMKATRAQKAAASAYMQQWVPAWSAGKKGGMWYLTGLTMHWCNKKPYS